MRGTPTCTDHEIPRRGIIPAYAGNTSRAFIRFCAVRDHPRVCGEHLTIPEDALLTAGSSPRMRGTLFSQKVSMSEERIIPAYAGNTKDYRKHTPHIRDHPRVCGEHLPDTLTTSKPEGSSPRMRGTPIMGPAGTGLDGIIPAYAGNTVRMACLSSARRDHPRVCGEHSSVAVMEQPGMGSSPRMRGTLR